MQGRLLAVISPANTPHGYNLTFAFPMLLFIIIAGALYLRFRSPHKVPGHVSMAAGTAGATGAVQADASPTTVASSTVAASTAGAGAGEAGTGADEVAASQAEPGGTTGQDGSEAEGTETGG